MAGYGILHERIAIVLGITEKTLRRHFREELDRGKGDADLQVINTLFKMAKSGRFPAATIFWVKTRCGWHERPAEEAVEISAPEFHLVVEGSPV
jgi:predicted transcriptional regulator